MSQVEYEPVQTYEVPHHKAVCCMSLCGRDAVVLLDDIPHCRSCSGRYLDELEADEQWKDMHENH